MIWFLLRYISETLRKNHLKSVCKKRSLRGCHINSLENAAWHIVLLLLTGVRIRKTVLLFIDSLPFMDRLCSPRIETFLIQELKLSQEDNRATSIKTYARRLINETLTLFPTFEWEKWHRMRFIFSH
jgi:hypothetical protein